MLGAEAAYAGMESDLQYRLDNYAALNPGYDEYRFDLDEIGHDPYVLISILSAFHDGPWTIDAVQGILTMLFERQYILTETVTVETRYRTETRTDTWTDADGVEHSDTYEVQVPYDYYIITVTLENFNLSHLPVYIMSEEQLNRYALYMSTLGNRPDLFPVHLYPGASTILEFETYDIPPEYLENEVFAAMITEANKYLGYPYVWGGEAPPDLPTDAPEAAELPALPPGTGTIIDYNTDPDGRLFYTIMTPDEHVFYLVIDKSSNTDNVYFLNAVTIADLAALAEIPATLPGGTPTTPPATTTSDPEQPAETPPPAEQPQSGGNMGMYIFIIVLAVAGGGAGWYFKIYRPKQQGAASGEEYDPSMDEAETDYAADWGEDSDEAAEGDDSPPWDEDGESGDEE